MSKYFLILLILLLKISYSKNKVKKYKENYNTKIKIGNYIFFVDIASDLKKRQKGMMFRNKIAKNKGMLFIFSSPQKLSFWMKNTLIPLDILFFNQRGILQEIKKNIPPCKKETCPTYPSIKNDNKYVIEIQGGLSDKIGIKLGHRITGLKNINPYYGQSDNLK